MLTYAVEFILANELDSIVGKLGQPFTTGVVILKN
jgi:hypothetical protein